MKRRCKHKSVDWTTTIDDNGDEVTVSRVCDDCGSWLSLGPSNDSPAEVQLEIRAAELAHDDYDVALFDDTEWAGWNGDETYSVGGGEPLRSFDLDDRRWVAGHLARCISNESETRAIHTSREERE